MPLTYPTTLSYEATQAEETGRVARAFAAPGSIADFPTHIAQRERLVRRDGPAIRTLLERHLYAYGVTDVAPVEDLPRTREPASWQRELLAGLERTLTALEDDHPVPAEFVFFAALDPSAVDSVAREARVLLTDPSTAKNAWWAFLNRVQPVATHQALPPLEEEAPETEVPSEPTAIVSVADLRARVRRGALRGRAALADA